MIGIIQAPLLVLGATGTVGRGVVEAAVAADRPVIAVARSAGELAQLRREHEAADLATVCGSITSDEQAQRLAASVGELGRPLGGVVVAVSSCDNRGGLLDQPTQALRCRLDTDLIPHLAAARAFLPLLARANRGGGYVVVGGPGSDRPWAGYGHRSIAAAGLRMLVSALHDEARPLGVRVQLLSVDAPARGDSRDACPHWPTAREIGRQALALLDATSLRGPTRAVVSFKADACAGADAATPAPLTARWLEDTRTLLASIAGGPGEDAHARDAGHASDSTRCGADYGKASAAPAKRAGKQPADQPVAGTARPDMPGADKSRAARPTPSPSDPHKEASP